MSKRQIQGKDHVGGMLGDRNNRRKLPGGDERHGLRYIDQAQTCRHEQEVAADPFDRRARGELLLDFFYIQVDQPKDQGKDRQPCQGSIDQEEGVEGCAEEIEGVVVQHIIQCAQPDELGPERAAP